jgi:alcohol dehydrogenase (cytochrome c)
MSLVNRGTFSAFAGISVFAMAGAATAATDWPAYNNTYDSQRFSPLTQITPHNAATMKPVCEIGLGDNGPFQAGPLMVNDTLYVTTGHTTVALSPSDCSVRWRHVYTPEETEVYAVNRGAAYLGGRLFRGTGDGRLIAIDAKTGKELWRVKAGDPGEGEFFSAAPIAWNDLVFIGPAGSDWGIKGRVAAFDANTGNEVWRFNTIPSGNEPGAETWNIPETAKHGGGGTWTSYTLDPKTGDLFVSVANPGPDFAPDSRPGDNLYTDSMVVLDARTGTLKWYYQLQANDGFDWDLGAAPMLYSDTAGRQLVALGSKDGHVYVMDRSTHKLLFKTAVTTILNADKKPTPDGIRACPGALGGVEWNGPSYYPKTNMIYVGAVDWCHVFTSGKPEVFEPVSRKFYNGTSVTGSPDEPKSGWITALDAGTGKVKWRYHASAPVVAGITPTAGGVVLGGDLAGDFYVFDANTGQLLYKENLDGALAGGIITYEIGTKQLVAATVGNIGRSTWGTGGSPRVVVMTTGLDASYQAKKLIIEQPELAARTSDPERGKSVYSQLCAGCHGAKGEGVAGAGVAIQNELTRKGHDELVAWIKDPLPPMPKLYPAPLTEGDVEAAAKYVETFTTLTDGN